MADGKENIYLCMIEMQEAREGVSPLPNRKIEFKFRKKDDKDALSFAKKIFEEEIIRAKEKGTIVHQSIVLYTQIMAE